MDSQQIRPENHTPNHIPLRQRIFHGAASAGLIAYGAYGIAIDDLFLPSKRGRGVHLHGVEAWLMFAAMAVAALNMISVIVDHFDKRNNETDYRRFAKFTAIAGWSLFGLSIAIHLLKGMSR